MDEQKNEDLVGFLSGLGFKGPAFESELRENLKSMPDRITIPFKEIRNQNEVNYAVYLVKDYQFDAYRLDKFDVTLRPVSIIEDKTVNGVAFKDLDQRMDRIHWASYFEHNSPGDPSETDPEITAIMSDLLKLNGIKDSEGFSIVPLLQYKHWPLPVFQLYNNDNETLSTIQVKESFSPVPSGICDTNLAYHILNGNHEKLYSELQAAAFDDLITDDFYQQIERILSDESAYAEVRLHGHESEYNVGITVPVHFRNGSFEVNSYTMAVIVFPEIQHGIFNDVDSNVLEMKMQAIDWSDDNRLLVFNNDRMKYRPDVQDVITGLDKLMLDQTGAAVADQLQAKYWNTAFRFGQMMTQSASDYIEGLPKREMTFDIGVEASVALNLLKGEAVAKEYIHGVDTVSSDWVRLTTGKGLEGGYEFLPIQGLSTKQIRDQLKLLPAETHESHISQLKRGGTIKLEDKDNARFYVKARPEAKTLELYDASGNYIPFNFKLSRSWSPEAKLLMRKIFKATDAPGGAIHRKRL